MNKPELMVVWKKLPETRNLERHQSEKGILIWVTTDSMIINNFTSITILSGQTSAVL